MPCASALRVLRVWQRMDVPRRPGRQHRWRPPKYRCEDAQGLCRLLGPADSVAEIRLIILVITRH